MPNDNIKVDHSSSSSIPFAPEGLGPTIHTTTITDRDTGRSVERSGYSREEADQRAGDAFRNGEK